MSEILAEKNDSEDSPKNKSFFRSITSNLGIIIIAVAAALLINRFILANARIPSASMEGTIMTGDRLFGFRLAYLFSDPKRGDIIIFPFPDNPEETYIKRIIGLPGDKVTIKSGTVYINGSTTPLDEPYLNEDGPKDYYSGEFIVPEDSYFVMGDNRAYSSDARYWKTTYVKREDIIAKAIVRYWPNITFLK